VRGDQAPLARFLHPDVGETVVIIVGLLAIDALFVINARHDGGVSVQADLHLGDLNDFYPGRGTGAIGKVASLAVGAAVFKRDDEVFIENRRENLDFVMLIAI